MGCNYTNDINEKLVPDTVAANLLGMERISDQSQINSFLTRFNELNIEQLEFIHHKLFMKALSLTSKVNGIVDFDMTGLAGIGKSYELAEKGYFLRKKGENNMKKYVMFVNNISGIGGAQLYILRKANFLLERGYDVYIITGKKEPIEFNEFQNLNLLQIKEILFPVNLFSNNKRNKILDIITKFIGFSIKDEVYIESHQTAPALWSEIFANRINSTNIVYAITPFKVTRKIYNKFFKKKITRNEFLGCNKSFIKANFPNLQTNNNNYINIPFDKSEIEILNCEKLKDDICDLNILTISRIDKTYIKNSIIQIAKYAKNNETLKIKYDIYTNKTSGDKYEELLNIIMTYKTQNLIVNLHGPVNPLNNCIFKNMDLFIGMGTAILNASSMKLPSLVVDYRNNKYYGFFGHDYFEFGSGEYLAEKELGYYINYLIKNKGYKEILGHKAYNLFMTEFENKAVNNKFLKYMQEHSNKYSEKLEIPYGIFDLRDLLDFILLKLFGIKNSLKIRQYIINIINRNENHI